MSAACFSEIFHRAQAMGVKSSWWIILGKVGNDISLLNKCICALWRCFVNFCIIFYELKSYRLTCKMWKRMTTTCNVKVKKWRPWCLFCAYNFLLSYFCCSGIWKFSKTRRLPPLNGLIFMIYHLKHIANQPRGGGCKLVAMPLLNLWISLRVESLINDLKVT